MNKTEFINFLESSLDFLDSNNKKSVIDFFEKKFSSCASTEEENGIIAAIGDPQNLVERLKNSKGKSIKKILTTEFDVTLPDSNEEFAESASVGNAKDVIFSKPFQMEKTTKIIQSFEDRIIKPLFGKRVSIKQNEKPVEEIVLEQIDKENGLTAEEIQHAKEETLEKAKTFTEPEEVLIVSDQDKKRKTILLEEDEPEDNKPIPEKPAKVFDGLFNQFVPAEKYDRLTRIGLLALLTIAVSPILFAILGLVIFIYAAIVAVTCAIAGILFGVMVAIIAAGVVELVHGFLLIFDSVPASLIELGFGTMLFSFVVAIGALIYELLFGLVPKWLKWITNIFLRQTKFLFCYLYGGKA